jgi:hypothetical protein
MATLDRPEGLEHELPRAVLQRLIKSAVRRARSLCDVLPTWPEPEIEPR